MMKLDYDIEADNLRAGEVVEDIVVTRDENGKGMSVVYVAWFGMDNAMSTVMNQDLVDAKQTLVDKWGAAKQGGKAPNAAGK